MLSENQYFDQLMRIAMNAKSVLVAAIFKKSLLLGHRDRQQTSTGIDHHTLVIFL
jgi:hypothetical protein